MEIAVVSYGSRGDVQPSAALARGLLAAGHRVRLAAPPNFAALAEDHGVAFAPTGVDLQAHLASRMGAMRRGSNPIALLRALRNEMTSVLDDVARDTWAACQGAELIVGTGPGSASVAEKLGVPFVEVSPLPAAPTRAFPSPVVSPRRSLGPLNRLSHVAFELAFWQLFRGTTNRMRARTLGLPPYSLAGPLRALRERGLLRLYAYSPLVVPRPDDWPAHHHVTGYWFLPEPEGWQPPDELRDFLESGPPPVYIGFGSMMDRDPARVTALVGEALERSGQRAVLVGGWGALDGSAIPAARACFVQSAPHHWLLPRVAAVVHHGGAGTTGAALRSGAPSVVVPYSFDQPFWAWRVAQLGVGPEPTPRPRLTAERLAAAIGRAVTDQGMRGRAAALGAQIRAEDGVGRAVELIHQAVRSRRA